MGEFMDMVKISIIVPVYNVSKYLKQCLDSITAQSYKNLEIILVDDGSTDGSNRICDEYADNDARIKVIHKENGGQASARNEAAKIAQGEYIIYIDSDDYINKMHIQNLIQVALEYDADLVQCAMIEFWDSLNETKIIEPKDRQNKKQLYTATAALKEFSYQRIFTPSPWCKLLKKDLMANIEFPVGIGYEDMAITYKIIGRAHKIVYIPEISYYYRQHQNSTMHSKFSEKKIDRIRIADQFLNYIKTYYPELTTSAYTRYLLAQLQLLMELPFDKKYKNIRNKTFNNIKMYRNIMLHDKEAPIKLKFMVGASYLGPIILMYLGRIYANKINRQLFQGINVCLKKLYL